ncbi:hypothetical protein [Streptomyces gilvosporeus]|uniref:Uncharacterized protein n=1 Tax=Streptomyces gilvosporeus TaxID=553510 RepID=A0A1V0U042_9ACTN|nr:hypothetical protein [Streptomyces gilvosporeus]ARF58420.1 hypothetical protein B1H19_33320 [Streptomyces gilvosporeus]
MTPQSSTAVPASRLRAHAAALQSHAERLRTRAAAVHWTGPEATAFHRQIEQLADRCSIAARALGRSAAHLDEW